MVRIDMKSSNLHSISYDEGKQELKVWFNNRKKDEYYLYEKVPPIVFGELMIAPSKGKYFFSSIRGKFDFKKVEE